MMKRDAFLLGAVLLLISLAAAPASAQLRSHDLRFRPPADARVVGFHVYVSANSMSYADYRDDVNFVPTTDANGVATYRLTGLEAFDDVFLAMRSYDADGTESSFSNEIVLAAQQACLVTGCNDNNPCTVDTCGATGCTFNPAPNVGQTCNDNNTGTFNDVCTASGACAGTVAQCNVDADCPAPTNQCAGSQVCSNHVRGRRAARGRHHLQRRQQHDASRRVRVRHVPRLRLRQRLALQRRRGLQRRGALREPHLRGRHAHGLRRRRPLQRHRDVQQLHLRRRHCDDLPDAGRPVLRRVLRSRAGLPRVGPPRRHHLHDRDHEPRRHVCERRLRRQHDRAAARGGAARSAPGGRGHARDLRDGLRRADRRPPDADEQPETSRKLVWTAPLHRWARCSSTAPTSSTPGTTLRAFRELDRLQRRLVGHAHWLKARALLLPRERRRPRAASGPR
jgi:hypothetical protein